MPTRATTLAEAELTQGEVKVIMNNQKVVKVDIKFLYQSTNCLPAQVHIGLGSGYYHPAAGYFTSANSGFPLFFIKSYALRPGKMVEAHKADIMAIISVTPPRITQAYNYFHIKLSAPEGE
jgi:hypothetical protein